MFMKNLKSLMSKKTYLTPPLKNEKLEEVERKRKGVERMLDILKVKAILLTDIIFITQDGKKKVIKGTEVLVDPETNIAQYERHHFDVSKKEYEVLYLN